MIVVPWSHDQPDNGMRVKRLGSGRMIPRSGYGAARVEAELRELLGQPGYAERAEEIGRRICAEDGVCAACDGLETALSLKPKS